MNTLSLFIALYDLVGSWSWNMKWGYLPNSFVYVDCVQWTSIWISTFKNLIVLRTAFCFGYSTNLRERQLNYANTRATRTLSPWLFLSLPHVPMIKSQQKFSCIKFVSLIVCWKYKIRMFDWNIKVSYRF